MSNMNTLIPPLRKWAVSRKWNFWLLNLTLLAGLIISVLSWIELCVKHCAVNHDYRLFGLSFSIVGIVFFSFALLFHLLSPQFTFFSWLVSWMIASALGAEIMFIFVQKYQIGQWCPVCLSVAAVVSIAALIRFIGYLQRIKVFKQQFNQDGVMKKIKQGLGSFSFLMLGFVIAFFGISKINDAEAAVNDIKDRMAFGAKKGNIEMYLVTDWFCPSCKKVEPQMEKIFSKLKTNVTFYFIDYPVHRKSLNFTPYNIAFLVNDKAHYFRARHALNELANKVETPNDEDISKLAAKEGIDFKELSFLEIRSALDFFDKVIEKYQIKATPTLIIVNQSNGKVVKLQGRDEITESKVLKAIDKIR